MAEKLLADTFWCSASDVMLHLGGSREVRSGWPPSEKTTYQEVGPKHAGPLSAREGLIPEPAHKMPMCAQWHRHSSSRALAWWLGGSTPPCIDSPQRSFKHEQKNILSSRAIVRSHVSSGPSRLRKKLSYDRLEYSAGGDGRASGQ